MKGIVSWFAANTVAANLLMVVAFIGGTISFNSMERELFPMIQINGASVSITWQGASPEDVEDQLIARVEEAIADIDGIKRITSTAREGVGSINIQGETDIDMDELIDEVERRVTQINNFPTAAFQPQIQRWERRQAFFGLTVHGDVDARTLKRAAEKVRDDIAALPGGQLAEVDAILDEEVSIEVTEESLRRYGMTFSQIAAAIRQSSINSSGGQVRTDVGTVGIQTRQQADTANEFGRIIISQSVDGGIIRVSDVANVIDGFVDEDLSATYNGERTAFVMINPPDEMDIANFANGFKKYMEESADTLPNGVSMDLLFDDSEAFADRMNTITKSAMMGAALVLVILLLFLRPAVAFWVTVGIITAFAGGTLLLPFFGVSFNFLSLFAVLLVIGVIVDDAIVVGENIHKEVESGRHTGLEAAKVGTHAVMKPVIFGVLTTIIAFVPWALISGPTRSFSEQISFVVMAALLFSLIESLLILPAHLSHMKPQNHDGIMGGITRAQRRIADSLIWFANNIYKPVLELAIRARYATVVLFFVLFALAMQLVSLGFVPQRFFPEIESDLVRVTIELPEGTPFSRTEQVRDQLEEGIKAAGVELDDRFPQLEEGFIRGRTIVASDRRVRGWINLVPPEQRPDNASTKMAGELMREQVGPIPDAEDINFSVTFNDNDTRISFALNHTDLDVLQAATLDVRTQLAKYDTLFDIGDNLSASAEEIRIELSPGAAALGLTLADVSNQVRQAYFGEEAQRLARNGEDARVMVRLSRADRENLDSLQNLRIRTQDGREIPLAQVAQLSFAPGINRIQRQDRTRSARVFAEVVGDTRGQIMDDMRQNYWPGFADRFPTISRQRAGGFEEEQEFFQELALLAAGALLGMYILLAIAFKSYFQPLLLMTAIPFAYAGAVFGHLAFDVPMAMFSIFGIGAAAGVVINDNLVLVDYVNKRREEGAGAVQALVDAGVSRFRPILLTSVTTFVGILPLLAERSINAQFLRPMVVSLGCAVLFALFVSLIMVPALYAVGTEIGRLFRRIFLGRPYRSIGETYEGVVYDDNDEVAPSPAPHQAPAE
ncbi:MAG: efflux RND transporter permease subunit [Hyphomonadaceae bacterium]